jgi:hypothetical protein
VALGASLSFVFTAETQRTQSCFIFLLSAERAESKKTPSLREYMDIPERLALLID